eukprot:364023-Chlamydomonas_euryale.AAC.3
MLANKRVVRLGLRRGRYGMRGAACSELEQKFVHRCGADAASNLRLRMGDSHDEAVLMPEILPCDSAQREAKVGITSLLSSGARASIATGVETAAACAAVEASTAAQATTAAMHSRK